MKKRTRILSLALCLAMMMTCVASLPALAEDEVVELTVLTMRWGDMGDSFTDNQWLKDTEEKLGVKINWIVVSNSDWEEQRGILLAGGDLPDIFIGNQTIRDADVASNRDYFLELTDVVEQYMPNYQHALETIPAMKTVVTEADGTMCSFSKIQPARPTVRNQLIINKTWLDNLNLDIPTNVEELKNVMVAFKEGDPNGNGIADEIPYSHNGDIPTDWLSPFGITDINETLMSITDGEPFFWPTSEGYKQGIIWCNELYELGVIDAEVFTQDWSMLTGKWVNEEVALVGMSYQWTPDAVFGQWSSEYIAIAPIQDMDGNAYSSGDPDGIFAIMNNEAHITTKCENVEMAAKWLDEFYTSEASIQNFWGAIDTVITKHDDGTYTLNDPPEGVSADAWYWAESLRDFGPKYIEPGFNDKLILDPTSGDGLKLEIAKMAEDYVTTPFPNLKYTQEENDELALLVTDISGYCQQMRAKWVTEGGIEEDWDEYIGQLNAMGLERFIEIRMDAYNRSKN